MKILDRLKRFRGFGMTPISFNCTTFNTGSIDVLKVRVSYEHEDHGIQTWQRSLFRFSLITHYKDRGKYLLGNYNIFFIHGRLFMKQLRPPADRCTTCGLICEDTANYVNGVPCCDKFCADIHTYRKQHSDTLSE